MANGAEIKAAAILLFLFFHLQMFLKGCKLTLYTATDGLEKSIKLYNNGPNILNNCMLFCSAH